VTDDDLRLVQEKLCGRFGVPWTAAPGHLKVGITRDLRSGRMPSNGLRHPPEGDTTGWYLWAGESFPTGDKDFVPLHVAHLEESLPQVLPYLGLPPGWRFLIDNKQYEDVWFDAALLNI
jgi:hypothetical protein